MLNVTDKAASVLGESLRAHSEDDAAILRLTQTGDGLGLGISEEQEGDQVVEHDGRRVLAIEPSVSQGLDGATIDAVETDDGQQLVLQGPEESDGPTPA